MTDMAPPPTTDTAGRRASRARRRDRWVYLLSHPILFAVLAALRRAPVRRFGRAVVVNEPEAFREALTRVPLDRVAPGTTGGFAHQLGHGLLFGQSGEEHRSARRSLGEDLSEAGVARLRPVWTAVLDRRLAPLAAGEDVDMVDVTAELAGATTAALLRVDVNPHLLTESARAVASAALRDHLPRLPRPGRAQRTQSAIARLTRLVGSGEAAVLATAGITTTVAAIPRAVAWCADNALWDWAADDAERPTLVAELLRVTAPSPVLPRVAASPGVVGGCPVRPGDRLFLIARHAVDAHRRDPDRAHPAPARISQLVFGAGPHACPGAKLARAQLADVLATLAPHRPVVVASRVDRHSALPGWATLSIRTGAAR